MKCVICKTKLTPAQAYKKTKTCSRSCGQSLRYLDSHIKLTCKGCGEEFKTTYGHRNREYCSNGCFIKHTVTGKPKSVEHWMKISAGQFKLNKEMNCECDRCGRNFTKWTSMRAHKAHCGHTKDDFTCKHCDRKFVGHSAFNLHLQHCEGRYNYEWALKGVKNCTKFCDTDIEIIFENKLKGLNVNFVKQWKIGVNEFFHTCDFYVPEYKLVIECDGDYWHTKPDVSLRDKMVNEKLKKLGYKVVRFLGTSIKQNVSRCVKEALLHGKGKRYKKNRLSRSL